MFIAQPNPAATVPMASRAMLMTLFLDMDGAHHEIRKGRLQRSRLLKILQHHVAEGLVLSANGSRRFNLDERERQDALPGLSDGGLDRHSGIVGPRRARQGLPRRQR